jgi:hypothetical protein
MTQVRQTSEIDLPRLKRQIERVVGFIDYLVGLTLTVGGLGLALYWHWRHGAIRDLQAFYLYTGWAFGTLELLAGAGMLRGWAARWIFQMLPLIIPIIAYQYFILHFIFRRL